MKLDDFTAEYRVVQHLETDFELMIPFNPPDDMDEGDMTSMQITPDVWNPVYRIERRDGDTDEMCRTFDEHCTWTDVRKYIEGVERIA